MPANNPNTRPVAIFIGDPDDVSKAANQFLPSYNFDMGGQSDHSSENPGPEMYPPQNQPQGYRESQPGVPPEDRSSQELAALLDDINKKATGGKKGRQHDLRSPLPSVAKGSRELLATRRRKAIALVATIALGGAGLGFLSRGGSEDTQPMANIGAPLQAGELTNENLLGGSPVIPVEVTYSGTFTPLLEGVKTDVNAEKGQMHEIDLGNGEKLKFSAREKAAGISLEIVDNSKPIVEILPPGATLSSEAPAPEGAAAPASSPSIETQPSEEKSSLPVVRINRPNIQIDWASGFTELPAQVDKEDNTYINENRFAEAPLSADNKDLIPDGTSEAEAEAVRQRVARLNKVFMETPDALAALVYEDASSDVLGKLAAGACLPAPDSELNTVDSYIISRIEQSAKTEGTNLPAGSFEVEFIGKYVSEETGQRPNLSVEVSECASKAGE